MKMNLFFCIFINILSSNIFAQNVEVATITSMSGKVEAQFTKGQTIEVKINQAIPEGAKIKTSSKSFVRMTFNDKSVLSLGPNSLMTINSFPKDEPGVITLLRGQVRSQVSKDYKDIADTIHSKLYIKTKTAALGVRGTDFQVNYNSQNQNTSLITFEGQVAMAYIEEADRRSNLGQEHLLKILNGNKTVLVDRGHISAINLNIAPRPMVPTILNTTQINILAKQNIDPSKLPNIAERPVVASDPNGFFHEQNGEYKLPAGSIVDLNTVNIIPPPKDALIDPKTNTYMVPNSHGQIDPQTGAYRPPVGLKLEPNGKFIPTNHQPNGSRPDLPNLYERQPPPDGIKPPPDGIKPPPDGIKPPPDGIKPPLDGIKPPLDGIKPPLDGIKPPPDGIKPPPSGIKPPPSGIQPPPGGIQPPPGGIQPPPSGIKPPPGGIPPK